MPFTGISRFMTLHLKHFLLEMCETHFFESAKTKKGASNKFYQEDINRGKQEILATHLRWLIMESR